MKTYCHKHMAIQAFQFNGTWQQLFHCLPKMTSVSLLNILMEKPIYNYNRINFSLDNHLARVQIDIDEWPMVNHKVKHPSTYWHDRYPGYSMKEIRKNIGMYKYVRQPKGLHPGDYVIVQYAPRITIDSFFLPKNDYESWYHISIVNKKAFENKWKLKV